MDLGVAKETTPGEHRVAIVPGSVERLVQAGHRIYVESGAGDGAGFADGVYEQAGAHVVESGEAVLRNARIIVKLNAPTRPESALLGEDHIVLAFFHFAGSLTRTELMLHAGCTCIGYETVDAARGAPLLRPMREASGQLAALTGVNLLSRSDPGLGLLPAGLPGVEPASATVLGCGPLARSAARTLAALGCTVTVVDDRLDLLARLAGTVPGLRTAHTSELASRRLVERCDLLIGAVEQRGGRAPVLVGREHVLAMRRGAVVVDAVAETGGCLETTRPTGWESPTYDVEGVLHCCVTNFAGRAGHSVSRAFSAALLPYLERLANEGYRQAARQDDALASGIQLCKGKITHPEVAEAFGMEHVAVEVLLG